MDDEHQLEEVLQNIDCNILNVYEALLEINKTLKRFSGYTVDIKEELRSTK